MSKITYAPIVPLIGGLPISMMESLDGQLPEVILSYSPFEGNDSHYVNYMNEKGFKGEYVFLDQNPDWRPKQHINVVGATCPCAGLSAFSNASSADNSTNDWMYESAEFVLGTVKPDVFWGENAPRLFTKKGEPVANRLFEIGQKHGYSLNIYYTESAIHGNPQKRARSFYFFTKSETAPVFSYHFKERGEIEKILKKKVLKKDPMNKYINEDNPNDNHWVRYCMELYGAESISDLYEKIDSTISCITHIEKKVKTQNKNFNDVADWFEQNGFEEKVVNRCRAMQTKLDEGKGYWGHGELIPKGPLPAFIGVLPHHMVNPFTGKYLTFREALRIMTMPEDFNLVGEKPNPNHICQNVPVVTAKDMMNNIIEYLNGECTMSSASFLKQNNVKQKCESVVSNGNSLDALFS